jgi:Malectin-like domain
MYMYMFGSYRMPLPPSTYFITVFFFVVFRYPDDPFDRIWESDASETQSDLALYNGAPGTQKVATNRSIKLDQEAPPLKVMQTAVVGDKGRLSYTINLPHFPGNAWVAWYLAEIEDLGANETRIFTGRLSSNFIDYLVVNNTGAMATERGYWDASLPSIGTMHFIQTNGSSRGPILNALEILKLVHINFESFDGKFV